MGIGLGLDCDGDTVVLIEDNALQVDAPIMHNQKNHRRKGLLHKWQGTTFVVVIVSTSHNHRLGFFLPKRSLWSSFDGLRWVGLNRIELDWLVRPFPGCHF